MTRIKVCCIASADEAALAVRLGAHAIGLVSAMPSGPGVIDERTIARIAATAPASLATFLLTSQTSTDAIVAQQRRCRTNTLQLVDHVDPTVHRELRDELPDVALVQVIHVRGDASVSDSVTASQTVDALLLDSGDPSAGELGGTGRTHDWGLSARIVEAVDVSVYLAGGLTAQNVGAAIRAVRPFGVDLCSGIRTAGRLDPTKAEAFFAAVRAAST